MLSFDSHCARRQPVAMLVSLLCCCVAHAVPQSNEDWIRGASDNLELRIRGEILDVDGQPAEAPSLSVSIRVNNASEPVDVNLDGHRFEVWLPAHRRNLHGVVIQAGSKDSLRRATLTLSAPELRQTASKLLALNLQPNVRSVTAKVVKDKAPVANANVKVETSTGANLHLQANDAGTVEIGLVGDERISGLTAWTDQPLFGGFQFSRQPVRDESADTQTIELFSCRNQRFRVVDGQGNPCNEVEMSLYVATPPPNFNYLGSIDASRMVTDENGEAFFRWFPDWEEVHCYVDLNSDKWVVDGESQWVDGDFVVRVKPRVPRRKVVGKLERDGGSKAGYSVSWRSFEGEQEGHSDFANCFTDQQGNFSADVLPGATYCVFINDTRDVSNMVDLIPAPTDDTPAATAVLRLQQPELLTISFTAGATKRPVANQPVHVRQTHRYEWMENGENRSGSSARDRYVYTDEQGKATAAVEAGKDVEVSIYNPDWRTSKEKPIVAGQQNAIDLHREIDKPRTILGVVLQDKEHPIPTADIAVVAGAVDGETVGSEKIELRADGVFQFKTQALAVGALAMTKDQSMAGVVVAENPQRVLRLYLRPTQEFRGRLIDSNGKPIAGRPVHATLRVKLEPKNKQRGAFYGFDANRQTAKTDADGYYTFRGMPIDVEISLVAVSTAESKGQWLGTVKLKANEVTAVDTHTIEE